MHHPHYHKTCIHARHSTWTLLCVCVSACVAPLSDTDDVLFLLVRYYAINCDCWTLHATLWRTLYINRSLLYASFHTINHTNTDAAGRAENMSARPFTPPVYRIILCYSVIILMLLNACTIAWMGANILIVLAVRLERHVSGVTFFLSRSKNMLHGIVDASITSFYMRNPQFS